MRRPGGQWERGTRRGRGGAPRACPWPGRRIRPAGVPLAGSRAGGSGRRRARGPEAERPSPRGRRARAALGQAAGGGATPAAPERRMSRNGAAPGDAGEDRLPKQVKEEGGPQACPTRQEVPTDPSAGEGRENGLGSTGLGHRCSETPPSDSGAAGDEGPRGGPRVGHASFGMCRPRLGELPHWCLECGKNFGQKGELEKHQLSHAGPCAYICSDCGRSFVEHVALATRPGACAAATGSSFSHGGCRRRFLPLSSETVVQRKERKELSLQEKVRVLEMLEGPKVSQSELAKRFGVSQPQICRIIKNKERILAEWCKSANPGRKRKLEDRAGPGSTALLQWFERSCVPGAPHNGAPPPGRAGHLCEAFGRPEWAAGWLGSAGARQKRPLPEEQAEAACWDSALLPCILSRYDPPDIYACGEAAILLRATPEDLALETRAAGQEQLTVLLCTNMDASDKRDALIVGKAPKLLPFQGAGAQEFLPATYRADGRAWMTAAIFAEWLQRLNEDMKGKRRSVVLFLAPCGAHPYAELSHVKMVFLPPGPSRVHPLEHGAIQSFRCHYRRRLLTRRLVALDGRAPAAPPGQPSGLPTLLDAVHTVAQAWSEVCPRTIQSGFRAAGLGCSPRLPTPPVDVVRALGFQTQEQFERFALVDEGLECFGEPEGADTRPEDPPGQDSVAEGRREKEDQPPPACPTKAEVLESLAQLRRYLECHAVPSPVFQAFYTLEDVVHGLSLADMQGPGLRT